MHADSWMTLPDVAQAGETCIEKLDLDLDPDLDVDLDLRAQAGGNNAATAPAAVERVIQVQVYV